MASLCSFVEFSNVRFKSQLAFSNSFCLLIVCSSHSLYRPCFQIGALCCRWSFAVLVLPGICFLRALPLFCLHCSCSVQFGFRFQCFPLKIQLYPSGNEGVVVISEIFKGPDVLSYHFLIHMTLSFVVFFLYLLKLGTCESLSVGISQNNPYWFSVRMVFSLLMDEHLWVIFQFQWLLGYSGRLLPHNNYLLQVLLLLMFGTNGYGGWG